MFLHFKTPQGYGAVPVSRITGIDSIADSETWIHLDGEIVPVTSTEDAKTLAERINGLFRPFGGIVQ